jgi:hypothetical protein
MGPRLRRAHKSDMICAALPPYVISLAKAVPGLDTGADGGGCARLNGLIGRDDHKSVRQSANGHGTKRPFRQVARTVAVGVKAAIAGRVENVVSHPRFAVPHNPSHDAGGVVGC